MQHFADDDVDNNNNNNKKNMMKMKKCQGDKTIVGCHLDERAPQRYAFRNKDIKTSCNVISF